MDGVRDAVMVRAALEYLELAKVRHALELMRSERLSAGRILDATRERADAGRELPIEVTRAQLTAARIEQRIAQLEDREDSLSGELGDMMGLPAGPADRGFDRRYSRRGIGRSQGPCRSGDGQQRGIETGGAEKRAREEKLKGERGGYWPTFSLDRAIQRA